MDSHRRLIGVRSLIVGVFHALTRPTLYGGKKTLTIKDLTPRGMTLVEVLVSLAILMIVGLGAVQLLMFSMRLNTLASQRSVATGLASERIQQLTSQRFQGLANYANYKLPYETAAPGPPPTLVSDFGAIPGYPDYRRVTELDYDTPVAGMLRVQVKVSWRSVWQGTKEHEMVVFLHPKFAQR